MYEMNLSITEVSAKELPLLQQISQATFVKAFGEVNTKEDMEFYLTSKMSLDQLTLEWQTSGSTFYFARLDEEITGYLKLNTGAAQNEQLMEPSLEVERIYVIDKFQGKGFGQQLLDFAIQQAQEQGIKLVWLGVWEHNHGARRFYERNGFVAFSQHVFMMGEDEQIDILMKREV